MNVGLLEPQLKSIVRDRKRERGSLPGGFDAAARAAKERERKRESVTHTRAGYIARLLLVIMMQL